MVFLSTRLNAVLTFIVRLRSTCTLGLLLPLIVLVEAAMTIAQALHSQEPKGLSKAVDNAAHQSSVQKEIHAEQKSFSVDFENFFGYRPNVVDRKFWLTLSDLSYLPKASARAQP